MPLFPYEVQDVQPQNGIPWNISQVNAPLFWPHTKGSDAVVAVVDTGLDVNHPEFTGRVISPRNFTHDGGWDDVIDIEGHGTHIAGIIAGKTTGIAPEARIMPLKVFGRKTNGFQFRDALKFILDYNKTASLNDRVVVFNASWGGGSYDAVLHYFIRQLIKSGVGMITSAGNAGDGDPKTSEIFNLPGFLYEPITVGATNQDGQPAGYSSSYDGIDVGAPGTLIYSAWPGGGYKLLSGTSMAAPHVTGAYALICAAFMAREGRYPTSDEAESILFKHIRRVAINDAFVGHGILDLTYETKRWPLYHVQAGAFFYPEGAEKLKGQVAAAGFSTFMTKY